MAQKPILKNVNKFSNIKLARGINIETLNFTTRAKKDIKNLGVSTKEYGKVWFVMPDGSKALFKTYNVFSNVKNKKLRVINELLCYNLAKQINMPCAKYEPAHIDNQVGLISYSFLKDEEYTKSLFELLNIDRNLSSNFFGTLEALERYGELGYTYNKRETLKKLYMYTVFDTITLQSDRHEGNIHFVFNDNSAKIKLAPSFDNEYAFSIDLVYDMYKQYKGIGITIDDLRDKYSLKAKYFTIMDELRSTKRAFSDNVKNICAIAMADKEFAKILNNIINNLNVSEAFAELEKQNYVIPAEYKDYVETVVSENINVIRNSLKMITKEDAEYFEEELIK